MTHEKSCGVIAYTIIDGEIHYLLVKQNNSFICFPKGHVEVGEKEEETALRELKEETGISATLLDGFRESISYYMAEYDATKEVVFFIGEIDSIDFHRQEKEIESIKLCKYRQAYRNLTFDNWKQLLKKADKFLKKIYKK